MKVDFHCHTTASDGSLTPPQLIDLALKHEIQQLAITDHDTTHGYQQVLSYTEDKAISLISGSEISCEWLGRTIHIVGLNIDVAHAELQAGLSDIRQARWDRANEIIEKLNARHNFHLDNLESKIQQRVGEGVVGRSHFAQLFIEEGLVKNTPQAFDKYLKKGRIGYVNSHWPPLAQVVGWIRAAGGVPVLAHPKVYQLTSRKLNQLISDFKEAGGLAIEVVNQPRHSADIVGMADRANRHELYASLGSDFHHPEHHWRGLGWLAPLPQRVRPVWELF